MTLNYGSVDLMLEWCLQINGVNMYVNMGKDIRNTVPEK